MSKFTSPSDFTAINPDYSTGQGYYTTSDLVADLLQIPQFTASSNPTYGQVGTLIKRMEDFVDEKTANSWRPLIYRNEYHNFTFSGVHYNLPKYWNDYVGFVQLDRHEIRRVIKLEVWQGNTWVDLASATGSVSITDYSNITSIVLKLPNFNAGTGAGVFTITPGLTNATFNAQYGNKTTAQDLVALINEVFPSNTAGVTGATAAKALQDGAAALNISDYFYAATDSEDGSKVIITSLLQGDDGTGCIIEKTGTGLTKGDFTDQEEQKRLGDWWKIDREGRIFFRRNFPYLEYNSCRVTYIAGSRRVPAVISDAATKLVACEILRHDDQTVLIAETGAQIDIKTKHDLLKEDAMNIINGKKETVFLIE